MRPYVDAELRDELRRAIDRRRRELEQVPAPCPIGYGNNTGYKAGCKCPECSAASTSTRRRWRQEHREQDNAAGRARRARRRQQLDQLRATG